MVDRCVVKVSDLSVISEMTSPRNAVLDLVRVVGMFFVMFIHSPFDADIKIAPGIFFLKSFLAVGAVPVFFLLSGYLGARKIDSAAVSAKVLFLEKWRSLVVPFLFWNSALLSLIFLLKSIGLESVFKGSGTYFDVNCSISSILSALFGIGRFPIVYQFWFLRDLIVAFLFAFLLCRFFPKIPLLPWFFFFIPLPMASSLGYYLLGHQLYYSLPPEKFPSFRLSILYCACWCVAGAGILLQIVYIPYPLQQIGSATFIFMLANVFGGVSLFARLSVLAPAVFFIYATHQPLQSIAAKAWQSLHIPAYGTSLCFIFVPAIVFPLCAVSYYLLRSVSPRLLAFATGGR